MKTKLLTVLAALAVPGLALAQENPTWQCTYGDMQRRIEVLYETGMTLPCEVHYYKDSEAPGSSVVLWRAQNQAGYCEARAEGLAAKLQGMGWDCGVDAAPAAAPAAPVTPAEPSAPTGPVEPEAPVDDTEVLAPADDGEDDN